MDVKCPGGLPAMECGGYQCPPPGRWYCQGPAGCTFVPRQQDGERIIGAIAQLQDAFRRTGVLSGPAAIVLAPGDLPAFEAIMARTAGSMLLRSEPRGRTICNGIYIREEGQG